MNLRKIRGLRYVRRFNFHHCNIYQNVAEHSFFVALIAREIALCYVGIDDMPFVYKCFCRAFFHDIEESITGDIPYLTKRIINMNNLLIHAMKEVEYTEEFVLEDDEKYLIDIIIEFADCFELKLYLEEERKSGNIHLIRIEQETYNRILESDLREDIKKIYIDKLDKVEPLEFPIDMTHEGVQ